MFEVATQEEHGDKRCRHHLDSSHVLWPVLPLVKRVQAVVTDTIVGISLWKAELLLPGISNALITSCGV
jgi:hypothetical protein